MAVSHVALLHELQSTTGFIGKVDAKTGFIGINAAGLNDSQIKALDSFLNRFKLPTEMKRVGAGVRLTIGLVRRTAMEAITEVDSTTKIDFDSLTKKADKNGNPGFNLNQKLNNYQVINFLNFYKRQGKAMTIKRSGTGLRFVIAKD